MPVINPPDSMEDLKRLRRPGRGIRTSDGNSYGGNANIWGRDMAITATDLIDIDPKISEEAITTLAEFQGTDYHKRNGEKPGRIHTEYREIFDKNTMGVFWKLGLSFASKILWRSDSWRVYTNYFSSDTTPLFIKLIYEYCQKYPDILDKKIKQKNDQLITIKECIFRAAEYIFSTVDEDGLIKIKENTLAGNQFRYWRDSPSSYRDENSLLPNIFEEMVILDVQALCADALSLAAEIYKNDKLPEISKWQETSQKMIKATIDNFWMSNEAYFAYAMDKSKRGHFKLIRTIQANPAWLLNTNFFDNLSDSDKQKYLSGIITRLFSEEFLTDAGIRCRSKKYMHDQNYQDYHGSWVSWPVESFSFAKGLRRQGFIELAKQIEARITNAVNICGVNYEYFIADENGKVLLNPKRKLGLRSRSVDLEILPECTIAWTVTASLKINALRELDKITTKKVDKKSWQLQLETEILNQIKLFSGDLNDEEISYYFASEPNLFVNQAKGFFKAAKTILKEFGPILLKDLLKKKK